MLPSRIAPKHPTVSIRIMRLYVGGLGLMMTALTGCQHISYAKSPLPVSVEPIASAYPYISYGYDELQGKLPACTDLQTSKSRQAPILCLPDPPKHPTAPTKPKRHFFLLEDWF